MCEKTGVNNRYQFRSLTNKLSKRDFDRRTDPLFLIATIVSCFLFYFSMFSFLIFVPFLCFLILTTLCPRALTKRRKRFAQLGQSQRALCLSIFSADFDFSVILIILV